ncbi:ATP synthase F1 subunit delta [Candidatus Dependentiae bacterium]|nr:ATP synthase F1 subunit delta [Candidatus Dependentiae bacterium]
MIIATGKITKRYAVAFLNVNLEKFTPAYIEGITSFASFISTNKLFQATLDIPSLPFKTKKFIVERTLENQNQPPSISKLVFLLLKDKRIDILSAVLKQIVFLYKRRENKYHFTVTTSHELTNQEQQAVTNFIKKQIPNHITTEFIIDTTLISGIRIEGDDYKWERSIAKKLHSIEQKILRQEELW